MQRSLLSPVTACRWSTWRFKGCKYGGKKTQNICPTCSHCALNNVLTGFGLACRPLAAKLGRRRAFINLLFFSPDHPTSSASQEELINEKHQLCVHGSPPTSLSLTPSLPYSPQTLLFCLRAVYARHICPEGISAVSSLWVIMGNVGWQRSTATQAVKGDYSDLWHPKKYRCAYVVLGKALTLTKRRHTCALSTHAHTGECTHAITQITNATLFSIKLRLLASHLAASVHKKKEQREKQPPPIIRALNSVRLVAIRASRAHESSSHARRAPCLHRRRALLAPYHAAHENASVSRLHSLITSKDVNIFTWGKHNAACSRCWANNTCYMRM